MAGATGADEDFLPNKAVTIMRMPDRMPSSAALPFNTYVGLFLLLLACCLMHLLPAPPLLTGPSAIAGAPCRCSLTSFPASGGLFQCYPPIFSRGILFRTVPRWSRRREGGSSYTE